MLTTAYPDWAKEIARERGWDEWEHLLDLVRMDIDAISLSHPYNFLTEEEVEATGG